MVPVVAAVELDELESAAEATPAKPSPATNAKPAAEVPNAIVFFIAMRVPFSGRPERYQLVVRHASPAPYQHWSTLLCRDCLGAISGL